MSRPTDARFLHVANGTSTTRTITAAGIPGLCSIWADPLHDGPVPSGLSDDELLEVRGKYLSGSDNPASQAWVGENPSLDPVNDLRQWRRAVSNHESFDELILWFEHDLFDQLNLVQLLDWIRTRLPETKPVSLICIGSFPGRPAFKGLGELTPDELAPLLETRQTVSDSQYELARRVWHAFREPTPEALDAVRRENTSALPYVAPAITRFLEEYPWSGDGLSRTERRLLELAAGEAIPLYKAFPRMHDGERFYYVTDGSLAELTEILSRASPPLIAWEPSNAPEAPPLSGSIALTDAGRAVLAGELDRVSTCGIDRWLGGVHLQGRVALWRWDAAGQRVVRI